MRRRGRLHLPRRAEALRQRRNRVLVEPRQVGRGDGPAGLLAQGQRLLPDHRRDIVPVRAQQLAIGTFIGAATLAQRSNDPLQTLRERVTSKGGTTYAAITSMEASDMKALFEKALVAAQTRAAELGRDFGK